MKLFSTFLLFSLFLSGCAMQNGLALVGTGVTTETVPLGDAYCGADEGAKWSTGNYSLKSSVDELDLGPLTLVSGKPHDGLHPLPITLDGQNFYVLAQYESCNSESLRLFTLDASGKIHAVPFLKNGLSSDFVSSDYQGQVGFENGLFSFCPYDNTTGKVHCDFYEYMEGKLEYMKTESSALEEYKKY